MAKDASRAPAARLEQLVTLNAIGEILNAEPSFEVAAEQALARLVELLGLRAGWLFMTRVERGDSKHGALVLTTHHGVPPALSAGDHAPLRSPDCHCQWLFRQGRLDAGVNIVRCSRLEEARGDTAGLEVHASIPLLGRRGTVGIMNLAAPGRARFDEPTLAFLSAVGRQLGTAFDRWRLLDERTSEARYTAALEERQRLATEVHDSLAQQLFAAELALQTALADPERGSKQVENAAGLVGDALERLRALVEVLRPGAGDASLETLVRRLAERLGSALEVSLEIEPVTLDEPRSLALYRVAQEATHNVLRHASARRLWLRLSVGNGHVTLRVLDDGIGLPDEAERRARGGMGLSSMRRRLEGVGGSLTLSARSGGGTVLEARVPWRG